MARSERPLRRLLAALDPIITRDLTRDPLTADEQAVLRRLARRTRRHLGCVRVRGYRSRDGYAYFRHRKRRRSVHRWLYETFGGDATAQDVDHTCLTRNCAVHLRTLEPWKNRGWTPPA